MKSLRTNITSHKKTQSKSLVEFINTWWEQSVEIVSLKLQKDNQQKICIEIQIKYSFLFENKKQLSYKGNIERILWIETQKTIKKL